MHSDGSSKRLIPHPRAGTCQLQGSCPEGQKHQSSSGKCLSEHFSLGITFSLNLTLRNDSIILAVTFQIKLSQRHGKNPTPTATSLAELQDAGSPDGNAQATLQVGGSPSLGAEFHQSWHHKPQYCSCKTTTGSETSNAKKKKCICKKLPFFFFYTV